MELNLKTEHIGDDRINISWNDAKRRDFEKGAKDSFVLLATAFFVGSLALLLYLSLGTETLSLGVFALLLIVIMFLMVKIIDIAAWSFPKKNAVIVSKSGIEHNGMTFGHDQISRIEYDKKSQWSSVQQGCFNAIEIRIWFADRNFYVISENAWEKRINHEIKSTIDEAVTFMKKASVKEAQQEEHGKPDDSNDFGMPEY